MASTARGYRLGVDVGGTFTDICVITPEGKTVRAKVPTNVTDQSIAVKEGVDQVRKLLKESHGWDGKFDYIHHGTTTATNAILEGKGVKTGLIVTQGHKDVLSMRRSQIPGGLGAWINWQQPTPIVPLERTVEAPERVSIQGDIVRPLDREAFRASLKELKREKPEAISVSLLNSFANNAHEEGIREVLKEEFGPDVEVVTSAEILPEIQEYERTVTTTANAVVKPIVKRYMNGLKMLLAPDTDTIRILKSDGDLTSVDLAGEQPVNILMSGPAGGVIGVGHVVSKNTPFKNLITLDMGGTSTDCALIPGTNAVLRRETVVGPLTVKAPSVDVRTVGAGGGSIANYNSLTAALRVGPESAGASPGPAAYGKGGTSATVTDANLVLGYLPSKLLGGKFSLDVQAAASAVESIATQMGMDVTQAAEGIINLVNETMYGALRLVSVEQGYDPREFALVAFGGAGPLHANAVGKLLGAFPVIIPPAPGILCAQGDATTKMSHEQSCTYIKLFSNVSVEELRSAYGDLKSGCTETMKTALANSTPSLEISYQVDMRYKGQALTLTVGMTELDLNSETSELLALLRKKFAAAHEQQFSFSLPDTIDLEIMRLRVKATDDSPEVTIQSIEDAPSSTPPESAIISRSPIVCNGEKVEAIFWDRGAITKKGYKVSGPCVITEMDSNTLILPGFTGEIDNMGNILIRPDESAQTWAEELVNTPESAKEVVVNNPLIPTLIASALGSIRREMDTLMLRCAMSPAIRDQQDEFNVITNTRGQMLVGQFGSFITQFLKNWKGTIEEGDVFVTNDVYETEGAVSHLNDVIVLLPIWYNGKIVGWAANFGHLTDVQGKVPGSMSINATTIFEDGLQIPSVKLYSKGVFNSDLMTVFCRNSRIPEWFQSDVTALVAACRTAAIRVCELCERYGTEVYQAACDDLLDRCRSAISQIISTKIGNERSSFTDFIDDNGQGVGPWAISCSMQKEDGNRLVFDWDGTSPQASTSMNYYLSTPMFKMFIGYFLLAIYDPHCVVNDGFHDLVSLKIPSGTILRPIRPAALSCRTHLLGRIMDVIQALFGQRNAAYRSAAGFSDSPHLFYSGFKPSGDWFLLYQIGFGGVPARPVGDGPDCHCLFPAIKSIPTESIELYFPLRLEANESVADSGGAGFHRGGNAQRTLYRFLCAGEVSIHDDRWLTKPWGVGGGEPGSRSRKGIWRYNSYGTDRPVYEPLPSKMDHLSVRPGDVLEWVTWGGGGLGDPLERPAELVALEVRRRLVTVEGARAKYGVVVAWTEEAGFEVDVAATEALRAEVRARRPDGWAQVTYNRGGGLEELLERCEAETGMKAPRPQWEEEPYGPHVAEPNPRLPIAPTFVPQKPNLSDDESHWKEYQSFERTGMRDRSLAAEHTGTGPKVASFDHASSSILLPSQIDAVVLMQRYFEHVDYHHHILYSPTVRPLVSRVYASLPSEQYYSPGRIALLLTIFASTAYFWRLTPIARHLFRSPPEALEAGRVWGIAALDVLELSRRVGMSSLEDVQAMIIASSLFYHTEGYSSRTRAIQNMALTMARDLGLHRVDFPQRPICGSASAAIENEMKRRVWWHLAAKDWTITDQLPPFLVPSHNLEYDIALDMDAKFQTFLDDLPVFFRLDPASRSSSLQIVADNPHMISQRNMIHIELHIRRSKLHQPLLFKGMSDARYARSRELCLASAYTVLEVSHRGELEDGASEFFPTRLAAIIHHIFMAAMILVMELSYNKQAYSARGREAGAAAAPQQQAAHYRAAIMEACTMLERAARNSRMADNLLQTFTHILCKHSISVSTEGRGAPGNGNPAGAAFDVGAAAWPAQANTVPLFAPEHAGGDGGNGLDALMQGYIDLGTTFEAPMWQGLFADLDAWGHMNP
ncbi:putative hydantoinase oxoprolinase protein [Neofusicoccum parvum UCRNP2]|uniref:Putative hydantoinase oxoprolinase protein n=1 Tax=Botryosphaeria parva (strain UCR-NP2) TaxID=1287680 RepID=R1EAK0_BOTPV|nr:putative hydantoinase oxoprolinase protein [Neofusicoccum parvum UCRNP2]